MTTLCPADFSMAERQNTATVANIFDLRARNTAIRNEVEAYCHDRGLLRDQAQACVDTAILARDAVAGKRTADRIVAKMQAIKARHWPRDPEPPRAA